MSQSLFKKYFGPFCVLACSGNVIVTHNSSSLTFNDSTAVAFQCVFQIPYSVPITYMWYVDGIRVKQLSSLYERYFSEGVNKVTCEASYGSALCEPCRKRTSLTVTVGGKPLHVSFMHLAKH